MQDAVPPHSDAAADADQRAETDETAAVQSTAEPDSPTTAGLEDLPPVEPPSAGMIVQLFLIPAVIVVVVIGVWALFGQLASSEQNLSQVVADLKTSNQHRRWRAAFNLAQMLEADARLGEEGQQLDQNAEIAGELVALLEENLQTTNPSSEDLEQTAFVIRSLGWFDVTDAVFPALQQVLAVTPPPKPAGAEDERTYQLHQELRRSALSSVALIVGRAQEQEKTISDPEMLAAIAALVGDDDRTIRQLTAYCLGLFPIEESGEALKAMLVDADSKTRLNAAIGLVRHDRVDGYDVMLEALQQEIDESDSGEALPPDDGSYQTSETYEQYTTVKNVLRAVEMVAPQLSDEQRQKLIAAIEKHHLQSPFHEVRLSAEQAVARLKNPTLDSVH